MVEELEACIIDVEEEEASILLTDEIPAAMAVPLVVSDVMHSWTLDGAVLGRCLQRCRLKSKIKYIIKLFYIGSSNLIQA